MDQIVVALTAFVLILPVELPDKTFVATLVLATRYRPLPVWLGVVAAFAVQCLIAVTAGTLLTLLPRRPVEVAAALLFALGAVLLVRGARRADAEEAAQEREYNEKIRSSKTGWRAALTSFAVLFTAEWADLSQLLTAGLAARYSAPVPVFFGAWAALAVVSGAAVLLGKALLKRVRLAVVRYLGAAVCAALAIVATIGIVTG